VTAARQREGRNGVRRSIAILAGAVLAVLSAAPVLAVPVSGTTSYGDQTPTSGQTFYVDASVHSETPVVPYEYAIQNECSFPSRSGSSLQHDDIIYWTSEDGLDPHVTMPIYLQSVPDGSKCKVFLMRNNTVVKESTTSYTVAAPAP
jgi:hypothetical protein